MNAKKWKRIKRDKKLLLSQGYFVEEKQEWHWHVRTMHSRRIINVWPSVGKWMEVGAFEVQFYTDILEAMKFAFKEDEANQQVNDLRSGGLDFIRNMIKKNGGTS